MDEYGMCDVPIYSNPIFEFKPGVTCLTGCNGAGKTTLMNQIYDNLAAKGISCKKFYVSELRRTLEGRTISGGFDAFADYMSTVYSSEGESVSLVVSHTVGMLGDFVFNECKDEAECWIFMDSLDSGLSVDVIRDFVTFLENVVGENKPDDLDIYIINSVNSFEFARNFDCVDVQTGEHLRFTDYDDYCDYILTTRKVKDRR